MALTALSLLLVAAPGQTPTTVKSTVGNLKVERLATLQSPWAIGVLPDGRLLLTEKPGRMRIWDGSALSGPLRGVPKVVYRGARDQGGLMDVAVDPNFASNNLIYFSYVEAASSQPTRARETGDPRFGNGIDKTDTIVRGGVVARARLDGNTLRDVKVIWRQTPKTMGRGHFGNRILVGPDGKLYITSGERMRFNPAQALASNLGKVVRINKDGSIPSDNPFAGKPGQRGDIWSLGHRNVLSAAFDPATGKLWALEMGPLGGDELNLVAKGKNYGWPVVSNGDNYNKAPIPDHKTKPSYTEPIRSWTPVISPSGAMFYSGSMFPAWKGHLFAGGLSSKVIIRLSFNGNAVATGERILMNRRIRDVAEAPDGAILAIIDDPQGHLLRLTPAG